MIVYPAYIYLSKEKETPANPNLWENGVINYPVVKSPNATFIPQQNIFHMTYKQYVIFTLPLKQFSKLTIRARGDSNGYQLSVKIFNESSTEKLFQLGVLDQNYVYDIPESYRKNDVQVAFTASFGAQDWLSITMS